MKFIVNRQLEDSGVIRIINKVDAKSIRRQTNDSDDEIIIIPSFTLPSGVVMNGGLYEESEIEKSYNTLEDTPAPIGHPYDSEGNPVSATSEEGINNFYAGVFNKNVERRGNRIYVEKHINVRVANQSDQGKELLSVIESIENGTRKEPISTSTGLSVQKEILPNPMTNNSGQQYTWIARNMHFDHDAILLNEAPAASTDQGVGMMVNKNGNKLKVEVFHVENELTSESMSAIEEKLRNAVYSEFEDAWMQDWTHNEVIFMQQGLSYQISYTIIENEIQFVGEKFEVERKVTWPKVKQFVSNIFSTKKQEDDDMALRELVDNALKTAGVDISNMSDQDKLEAYQKLATNKMDGEGDDKSKDKKKASADKDDEGKEKASNSSSEDKLMERIGNMIDEKLAPVVQANNDREQAELNSAREACKAVTGLEDADLEGMSVNALKNLTAKSKTAVMVPGSHQLNSKQGQGETAFNCELPD